jgi:hypothetical protein
MEPPQLPQFQYTQSPPYLPPTRPPQPSQPFAQVEPPRVQELSLKLRKITVPR